eukprot:377862_1
MNEMEFISVLSDKWDNLKDPLPKYSFGKHFDVNTAHFKLKSEVMKKIDILDSSRYKILMTKAEHAIKYERTQMKKDLIMAILLFVDFPELRRILTSSFIKAKTPENLKKVYKEYSIWLRLLRETITLEGKRLDTNKSIYYIIDEKMLFHTFKKGKFCSPKLVSPNKIPMTHNSNKIVLELKPTSESNPVYYFDVSKLYNGKDYNVYILFDIDEELTIKNITFMEDNTVFDKSIYIEAISLFENIMNDEDEKNNEPSEECKQILQEYIARKLELKRDNARSIVPCNYYHELFGSVYDYYENTKKITLDKLINNIGIKNITNDTKEKREQLQVGSSCQIYSEKQKQWFTGEITNILEDEEGEWLSVVYRTDRGQREKQVQRFNTTELKIQKWYNIIWKYCKEKYGRKRHKPDEFINSVVNKNSESILEQCNIKYNEKLALRIKTVLSYYKYTKNTIPDFDRFKAETNITLESYMYEKFKHKYVLKREQIQKTKNKKEKRRNTYTVSDDEQVSDNERKLSQKFGEINENNYVLYDVGVFMRYVTLKPRFESLAEELMFNDVINITNLKFNKYLSKAKKIHADNCLTMVSIADDYKFGVKKFSPISISHILAIVIHTEETNYSRAFTRSCLSLKNADSEIVIQNHVSNFYWFGYYLYVCIEFYGEQMSNEEENSQHLQGYTVPFKFDLFNPPINYPRATTESLDVAQHYAGDKGIILQFIPKYTGQLNAVKFIDLFSMSNEYDDEKRVFFGRACAMQISNIYLQNKTPLKHFLTPLLYLEKLCLQTIFDRQFYNAKELYDQQFMKKTQSKLVDLIYCCIYCRINKQKSIENFEPVKNHYESIILNSENINIEYFIDLLIFWSSKKVFLSFETLTSELRHMSSKLRGFFMTQNKQVNINNIQLLFPNIKYYRDCDKKVKYIKYTPSLIDIMNENLPKYPTSFKHWCNKNKIDEKQVLCELSKDESESILVKFDKDLNLLQQSIMPYNLYNSYDDETKINPISPEFSNDYSALLYRQKTLMRNQSVQTQQSVRRTLSNCQRHEVPYLIIEILTELNFIDENTQEIPETFRNALEKYYDPISKLDKATQHDFVDITNSIIKDTNFITLDTDMIDELCNKLIKQLFMDIEKTKPWKCNCWFINRKIMVNGLWRLYNQLNVCGMCGAPRAENKIRQRNNSINDKEIDESNKTDLKLPDEVSIYYKKVKLETCEFKNDDENIAIDIQLRTAKEMTQLVREWIINIDDNMVNQHEETILKYFQDQKIDESKFMTMKKKQFTDAIFAETKVKKLKAKILRLYAKLTKQCITCHCVKRIGIILDHFHKLTSQLKKTNKRYPYLIRQFLSKLNETNQTQLLNDYDHILQYHPTIMHQLLCPNATKCIHLKRAKRNSDFKQTLQEKQELFNSNDWKDFVYISFLDKIHCVLLHNASENKIEFHNDTHAIKRYSKFPVYATGVYFQYDALSPLYFCLKEELTTNLVYSVREKDFEEAITSSKNILNTNKMKEEKWKAKETNEIYGIKIGDPIQIEHILVIYLYTGNSELCAKFRESYRSSDYDDNNQNIRRYHVNNFYWMGRFIFESIEFFGERPGAKDIFFHGQTKKFLFTEFSTILEAPTSTTSNWSVANNNFAGDNGIVLKLGPKFKNELNNNKYLNVSSISEYNDEKEKLFAGMTVLAIIDIGYAYANRWYWLGHHTKVLLYFERLITQTIHQRNNYNYGFVSKSVQKKYLIPLIEHQINRNREHKIQHIAPERHYLYALFEHFCDMRTNYIDLTCIHKEIETMHRSLINILFEHNTGNHKHKINNESIKLIFPKLKGYKNHLGYWINFS